MATDTISKPIRAAIFHEASQAEEAVRQLEACGFTADEITVVCSDQTIEARFRRYEHQEPAGFYSRQAVTAGAVAGALLGGSIALVMMIFAGGGALLLALTGLCMLTGGLVGGFLGEMVTRAAEGELANFYSDEVQPGEILVAAEGHHGRAAQALEEAEHIFERAGAKPLQLSQG